MNGVAEHQGFSELMEHLYRLMAPAYKSVPAPSGTARSSRLYAPCSTPQPATSPQFSIAESEIEFHDVPPFRLCQIPPSTGISPDREMNQAYISLRPGTAVISAR